VIKAGVIGVGVMGRNHARVYKELDRVNLVGVYDVDESRSSYVADLYDVKKFSKLEDLLEAVDVVSIVVPTSLHHVVVEQCSKFDIGILLEKPIADSIENADKIIDLTVNNNLFISIGHIERFNPAVVKLKEVIQSGELGYVLSMFSKRVGPFVDRIMDVGVMVDLAIHDVDVMSFILDRIPIRTGSQISSIKNNKGDHGALYLRFDSIVGIVMVNWFTPTQIRELTVTGTSGVAYLDYISQEIMIDKSSLKMYPKINKEEPLKVELNSFLDAYENKDLPPVDVFHAKKMLELVC